jgi:hypothetical protein
MAGSIGTMILLLRRSVLAVVQKAASRFTQSLLKMFTRSLPKGTPVRSVLNAANGKLIIYYIG